MKKLPLLREEQIKVLSGEGGKEKVPLGRKANCGQGKGEE